MGSNHQLVKKPTNGVLQVQESHDDVQTSLISSWEESVFTNFEGARWAMKKGVGFIYCI